MAKERYRIKSECPECGCGLIDNMTPDEFREKTGGSIKEKVSVTCNDCGTDHDGHVTEDQSVASGNSE